MKNNVLTALQTAKAQIVLACSEAEQHRNNDVEQDVHTRLYEQASRLCALATDARTTISRIPKPTSIPRRTVVHYIGKNQEIARITEAKEQ